MCVPNIHYKDAFKSAGLEESSMKTAFHIISLQIPMEKS